MNEIREKYKIDFNKINSINDIKLILKALDLTFVLGGYASEQDHAINEMYMIGLLKKADE